MTKQDEEKIRSEFNQALKAINALTEAMAAIKGIGEIFAQFIDKVEDSSKQARQAMRQSLAGVKARQGHPFPRPLAQSLEAKINTLYEKNKELKNSLAQLNTLQGSLPQDQEQPLRAQLNNLDQSIRSATAQARQPEELTRQNLRAAMLGSHHRLTEAERAGAERVRSKLDASLAETSTLVQQMRTRLQVGPVPEGGKRDEKPSDLTPKRRL